MKTWHIELSVVAVVLITVTLLTNPDWVNWVTTLAILFTFNHAQIGDRLQERQAVRQVKDVPCYYKLNKLFAAKEVLWIIAFLLMHNYAAIVGSGLFALYPYWRKLYRKHFKPLTTQKEKLLEIARKQFCEES